MRLAAVADVHAKAHDTEPARISALFEDIARRADVLALCGDLTDHGRAAECEMLLRGLDRVRIPILAILGNHDHESSATRDLQRMLSAAGVHVLDRSGIEIEGVGFAGVKGFAGGFADKMVRAFGEESLKAFVAESVVEAEALRGALRSLSSKTRVALTHYSPVVDTLQGEPVEIHAFLGTSRLAQAIDEGGAALALHGHAHHGAHEGRTPQGVPVRNVSLPVLRASGSERGYFVAEV